MIAPGPYPPDYLGGSIQRIDLATGDGSASLNFLNK